MMPGRRDYPLLIVFFIRDYASHFLGILALGTSDIVAFINVEESRFFQAGI